MNPRQRCKRRFFIPEVVQTSAMDCGPATLKCLLEGYGIPVSYGRLREACQTDVDGTSIDTIEEAAGDLGLKAEQVMIPADHLLVGGKENLPAIAVVLLPNGMTHFIVIWRIFMGFVQIMDPATGRLWVRADSLIQRLYRHTTVVPAKDWREWAVSGDFLDPLAERLRHACITRSLATVLIRDASADASWRSLAALDALTRFFTALQRAGFARDHKVLNPLFERIYPQVKMQLCGGPPLVPSSYWTAWPATNETGEESIRLSGAVLVRVLGRSAPAVPAATQSAAPQANASRPRSRELAAALAEKPAHPLKNFLALIRADGILAPSVLLLAMLGASAAVVTEAVLWRSLMEIGRDLGLMSQKIAAIILVIVFGLALLVLDTAVLSGALRLGRRMETLLRIALMEKIPRLYDRYFNSRLLSDMAERSHSIRQLRNLPVLGRQFLKAFFELLFCAAGVVWIYPGGALDAALLTILSVAIPLLTQPLLAEKDLRAREHGGSIRKFYLDALLGLIPVKTHSAERPLRREHENLLVEWLGATLALQRLAVFSQAAQNIVASALMIRLVFGYFSAVPLGAGVLLLVYWAMSLPMLGAELAVVVRQYPLQKNLLLRLLEPLNVPSAETATDMETTGENPPVTPATVSLKSVTVMAAGHTILKDISLDIAAGSHIAVIGKSGAGKSSLVGLLLGWHRPVNGTVEVDGRELAGDGIDRLRRATAWLDPAVQIWNRSLWDNLKYGLHPADDASPTTVISQAGLESVLRSLPDGLMTKLGESGALVSGGEGQRVRLGRALNRPGARLVLLDEPFRGLDAGMRAKFLTTARAVWRTATLLCVTHDIAETLGFNHVIVMAGGRIVEAGAPTELMARANSVYARMLAEERLLKAELWSGKFWRKLKIENGRLTDSA